MAQKCFKYRGNTYTSEELFQKIRRNAEQFAKRHKISGREIAKAAEKDINFSLLTESDFDADGNVKPVVIAEIKAERERIKSEAQANGTWMKAPNGADTNLNEQQYIDVRTKRFTDWFGDWQNDAENASKVVDNNGEPLVVYHGTDADFNEFKLGMGRFKEKGLFFSGKKYVSDIYGKNNGAFFLNFKNPLIGSSSIQGAIDKPDVDGTDKDGVINKGTNEFVAINPNQIKSATSNVGTYSSGTNNINFSIQSNQQTPLPHKNTIPNKTFKDVMDILASQGLESAENALKTSSWYNNLSDTKKQEIDRKGLAVAMQNEAQKIIENAKVAQRNAVASERTKSAEKVKAVKKDYKNKIQEMRDKFDDRIKKIKESNKDAKQKIRDRKSAVREMVADVKSFLASNKIDGLATPTEINRLIKAASELSQRRDLSKALTEFERLYNDIQTKAEDRRLKDENRTLSDTEFESLETIVTDQLSQGTSQADIEQLVKSMQFPFSKAGTLSDSIKSEIEKIKNRYETNQLTPEQKLDKSREAQRRSNEILKNKNKNWARDVKRKLITNFTDRQFLAKYLSAKLGMINTYNRIIVASGVNPVGNANSACELNLDDIRYINRWGRSGYDIQNGDRVFVNLAGTSVYAGDNKRYRVQSALVPNTYPSYIIQVDNNGFISLYYNCS